MRILLVALGLVVLSACSAEPGSEGWCKAKKDQSKSEWSSDDAMTFAKHCMFDSTTIGSKEWCKNLADKPKGEWTSNEAGDYTKHCVL